MRIHRAIPAADAAEHVRRQSAPPKSAAERDEQTLEPPPDPARSDAGFRDRPGGWQAAWSRPGGTAHRSADDGPTAWRVRRRCTTPLRIHGAAAAGHAVRDRLPGGLPRTPTQSRQTKQANKARLRRLLVRLDADVTSIATSSGCAQVFTDTYLHQPPSGQKRDGHSADRLAAPVRRRLCGPPTSWPRRRSPILTNTRTPRSSPASPALGKLAGARVLAEIGDDRVPLRRCPRKQSIRWIRTHHPRQRQENRCAAALKLLPREWSADADYRARFNREADLAPASLYSVYSVRRSGRKHRFLVPSRG